MRNDKEYQILKAVATYLRYQYPAVMYHWDYAGLNLSKAQAGKMKAIQVFKGWPDLFIAESRIVDGDFVHGLFIEIKPEGTKLWNKRREPATLHLDEQQECLYKLRMRGYVAKFAVGFSECKDIIDEYLKH